MSRLTVGMTYDLRRDYLAEGYSEADVAEFDSDSTIDALAAAIAGLGYRVERIGNARSLCRQLVDGQRWDLVFNIAEGLRGRSREAQVPAILELYDIPYCMSDPLVCAVTLDKAIAKRLVRDWGVPTPKFAVVTAIADLDSVDLEYPVFAKPLAEGTGKGVTEKSKAANAAALAEVCQELLSALGSPVLVEEYLPGREFTTGVLGTGAAARALGTMEIEVLPDQANEIYSYEAKELCETQVRYSRLGEGDLKTAVEDVAVRAYRALECRDTARVDIRLDPAGQPSFIEVNPLPGLHPTHSDLPMIATNEGMPYQELIGAVIASARTRIDGGLR